MNNLFIIYLINRNLYPGLDLLELKDGDWMIPGLKFFLFGDFLSSSWSSFLEFILSGSVLHTLILSTHVPFVA